MRGADGVVAIPAEVGLGGKVHRSKLTTRLGGSIRPAPAERDMLHDDVGLSTCSAGAEGARDPKRAGARQLREPCGLGLEHGESIWAVELHETIGGTATQEVSFIDGAPAHRARGIRISPFTAGVADCRDDGQSVDHLMITLAQININSP